MSGLERRWMTRPAGSTWGEFGDDDERGRLNLITPERRLAAVREVQAGIAFALSLPLDAPMGGLHPPFRHAPLLGETAGHSTAFADLYGIDGAVDIGCDDVVTLNTQYSTQWDALCHVGAMFDTHGTGEARAVYYNGFAAGTDIVGRADDLPAAARRLGIEHVATTGVQGRGVLVDLHDALGEQPHPVGLPQMLDVMADRGAAVEPGDILVLHTGFAAAALAATSDDERRSLLGRHATLDGHDARLLDWIADSGIAAIAADNLGVEGLQPALVAPGTPALPLHHHCLFKLGIPLGELWYLTELAGWLADAGRTSFLLTAPPLRLTGAVGSPVTPVATV